ncbi:MAG: Protoheme farnesyltransferase [Candidatus Adlerbacteria bacterium]|nr:Protoheme farnesyltransferase [Candidatus Adlerbacteria bacterium]
MTDTQGPLKTYYRLTKPGIVYGNILVAAAAFIYASHSGINWMLFGAAIGGLALVIASACVVNNYYDRDIDARMERTKQRAFPSGRISARAALIFSAVLLVLGVVLLNATNGAVLLAALVGFVVYVFAYTPLKHHSAYALFVGAVAGATPPLVGYAAAAGVIDYTAWLMFAFLFLWQLPHFLAIAVYRGEEYAAAKIPMFMKGSYSAQQKKYARWVFYLSLVVLLGWCCALIVQR